MPATTVFKIASLSVFPVSLPSRAVPLAWNALPFLHLPLCCGPSHPRPKVVSSEQPFPAPRGWPFSSPTAAHPVPGEHVSSCVLTLLPASAVRAWWPGPWLTSLLRALSSRAAGETLKSCLKQECASELGTGEPCHLFLTAASMKEDQKVDQGRRCSKSN